MKKIILSILFTLAFSNVFATTTGRPISMRSLVEGSDYIITGTVIKIIHSTQKGLLRGNCKAIIVVDEILKGDNKIDTITVEYFPHSSNHIKEMFKNNSYVFAFLYYREKEDLFTPRTIKTKPKDELSEYISNIKKILTIIIIDEENINKRNLFELFIKNAENSHYSLNSFEALSVSKQSSNTSIAIKLYDELNEIEKNELLDSLQISEQVSYRNYIPIFQIDLFINDFENEIYNIMKQRIKKMRKKDAWLAGILMERICNINKKISLQEIYDKYDIVDRSKDKDRMKKLFKLTKKFRKKL